MLEIDLFFSIFLVKLSGSMKTRAGGSVMQTGQSLINMARLEQNAAIAQVFFLNKKQVFKVFNNL